MKTLAEIELSTAEMLTPTDIAPIFPANPQSIRLQARDNPEQLGFPVICIGSRVYIPKHGFLRFCRGLRADNSDEQQSCLRI